MNDDLTLPESLSDWLADADESTVVDHTASVDVAGMEKLLKTRGLRAEFLGEEVSRGQLFALAAEAPFSADAALNLLWNTLAWQSDPAELKDAVNAIDPGQHSSALMEAATLAGIDPTGAFRALNSGKRALPGLRPEVFTAYLYFAGGGNPEHPSLIFTDAIAAQLERFDWEFESDRAGDYARYCGLVRVWAEEAGVERRDLVELGLASLSGS